MSAERQGRLIWLSVRPFDVMACVDTAEYGNPEATEPVRQNIDDGPAAIGYVTEPLERAQDDAGDAVEASRHEQLRQEPIDEAEPLVLQVLQEEDRSTEVWQPHTHGCRHRGQIPADQGPDSGSRY